MEGERRNATNWKESEGERDCWGEGVGESGIGGREGGRDWGEGGVREQGGMRGIYHW